MDATFSAVMPGLDPGIHATLKRGRYDVDDRVKPGHDIEETPLANGNPL
ncbi:hypothetical protein [Azospirillum soli]|nr:hypothetical protein [Azospirillum soli]MBP2313147.1 hypothetical protein [Azospirillum soli]